MVEFHRRCLPVDKECRRQPRYEFHLPVSIMGMDMQARVLDFSLVGFYIQVDCTSSFSAGQLLRLALRFPGERNLSMIKVRVERLEKQGIGCAFIDLDPTSQELIERNFDIFSGTLPIQ